MGDRANEIRLKVNELTVRNIKQFFIDCNDKLDRFEILVDLYGLMTVSQSMIFVDVRIMKSTRYTSSYPFFLSLYSTKPCLLFYFCICLL